MTNHAIKTFIKYVSLVYFKEINIHVPPQLLLQDLYYVNVQKWVLIVL